MPTAEKDNTHTHTHAMSTKHKLENSIRSVLQIKKIRSRLKAVRRDIRFYANFFTAYTHLYSSVHETLSLCLSFDSFLKSPLVM